MSFVIGLKIIPQVDPSQLSFLDNSTANGETVTAASVTITKIDLIPEIDDFLSPFTVGVMNYLYGGLDKDYALDVVYSVTTNVTTYTQEYQFVTLGYSNQLKKNREFILQIDKSLQDKQEFKKETLDINYYRLVAKDRCRFSDLIGAQKALDFIADMNLGPNYTKCFCNN